MQDLKITDKDSKRQYHIAYLNDDTGVGGLSPAEDGHTHELIYDPPRPPRQPSPAIPPQVDPMTGQPMINPQTGQPDMGQPEDPGDPGKEVGEWVVAPGGEDQHEHKISDYVVKIKEVKQKDSEIITECLGIWKEALKLTEDCRKKGRASEDFYQGKQWSEETKRQLESNDLAALTINEIAPNIDTLIGYQMEQRTDLRYLPQEGGDQKVADILNIISKKLLDACYFQREETKVFKDMCLPGMGVFNIYIDFNKTIQGDIIVERFPWDGVVYGEHEKEDLSDCELEIRFRMQSIAKLKQMFGKKAKEIEKSYSAYKSPYSETAQKDVMNATNTDYRGASSSDELAQTVNGSLPLVDMVRKQFQLVQVTRKIYKEVVVIFNQEENFFFTAYDWKPEDVTKASEIPGFQFISQMKPRMRITKFCGSVVLSDENPAELPSHKFYTVPVYAYRQNGEYWGKVEAAKDPQRELNKRRSQVMDTMNKLGASVYFIEEDTFVNPQELEKFKKNRSKPGSIFKLNDLGRKPDLTTGAELPAALVQILQLDQQNLQRLMNVVVEQAGANESGTLFLEKKKGRLTGNQSLFDNLSFAKQEIGRTIIPLIQEYYEPERILRLLNAEYSKNEFELDGQDFAKYEKEEILELLGEANLLEYDVVVAEGSYSASTRLGIAKMLFDLIGQGAQLDPGLPLEFLDIPSDVMKQIKDSQQAQSQASAQAQSDVSNSEISKTLIAKGEFTITPEKANELGLVPTGQNQALQNSGQSDNNGSQADEYANRLAGSLAG